MTEKYFSYLLRLWRTDSLEQSTWRVMLENPQTREVIGFDGLVSLFEFLQRLTGGTLDPDEPDQLAGGK